LLDWISVWNDTKTFGASGGILGKILKPLADIRVLKAVPYETTRAQKGAHDFTVLSRLGWLPL
jgi:hypothetical protein